MWSEGTRVICWKPKGAAISDLSDSLARSLDLALEPN